MKLPNRWRALLVWLWAVLLICVVIGSLLPPTSPILNTLDELQISDKILHFGAYLVLALLPVIAFQNRKRGITIGALMVLLGLVVEGCQSFVARDVEFGDIIANTLGVVTGILAGRLLRGSRW